MCHSAMLWAVHRCQQTEAEHHYCMRGQLTVSLNGSQLYTLKPAERSMSQLQQVERACLCTRLGAYLRTCLWQSNHGPD